MDWLTVPTMTVSETPVPEASQPSFGLVIVPLKLAVGEYTPLEALPQVKLVEASVNPKVGVKPGTVITTRAS